jgi:chromosome transmission fidelity protein 4
MDSTAARPRARPAHTPGITRCAYTPDGARLVTAGSNNTIRLYRTGHDGEPANIDDCQEQNVCVAAGPTFFVVGAEDGTVSLYSLASLSFERYLVRCALPVRDVAVTPDGKWCAIASDELTVKLVSTTDASVVRTLSDHPRPARHVSFDPRGGLLAVTAADGIVYVYSLLVAGGGGGGGPSSMGQPELIHKIEAVAGAHDPDNAEPLTRAVWHPDGRAFAISTPTRDIQVVSKGDWERQRAFANGHTADITALAWSPNGALLASAARDGRVLLWETRTQSVVARYSYANVTDISWHPSRNLVSLATNEGEIYIYPDFIADQYAALLKLPTQPAPFIHDPLEGGLAARPQQQQQQHVQQRRPQNGAVPPSGRPRRESLGSVDSFLNGHEDDEDDYGADGDDFVVDDDNAGYAAAGPSRKRAAGGDTDSLFGGVGGRPAKRRLLEPAYHEPFQPGATPWRGNRKYLCLNLVGFVWTVDQDSHYTVTVEFYDRELQRDFHFTDTFLYDKACLSTTGALFACPPRDGGARPAVVFYRPHETWTRRTDWRIELSRGEAVAAMSLGESFITVATTADYVRVYTLFGVPHRVYRAKSSPIVSCASWRDYVLTMGNGPVGADGQARLLYSIENVKRDELCQNEDTVALPPGETVRGLFWSDRGVSYYALSLRFGALDVRHPRWIESPAG